MADLVKRDIRGSTSSSAEAAQGSSVKTERDLIEKTRADHAVKAESSVETVAPQSGDHSEWAGMDDLPNEILDMIYAQCSRSRLLTCMRLSRRQFELIVPRIWGTLALGHVQSMNLTKMRESADSARWNTYASAVTICEGKQRMTAFYDLSSLLEEVLEVFPNIEVLRWILPQQNFVEFVRRSGSGFWTEVGLYLYRLQHLKDGRHAKMLAKVLSDYQLDITRLDVAMTSCSRVQGDEQNASQWTSAMLKWLPPGRTRIKYLLVGPELLPSEILRRIPDLERDLEELTWEGHPYDYGSYYGRITSVFRQGNWSALRRLTCPAVLRSVQPMEQHGIRAFDLLDSVHLVLQSAYCKPPASVFVDWILTIFPAGLALSLSWYSPRDMSDLNDDWLDDVEEGYLAASKDP